MSEKFENVEPLLYVYNCKSKSECPDKEKIEQLRKKFLKAREGVGDYDKSQSVFDLGIKYKGVHECNCGVQSSNCDYLLPGNKYFTNSLCIHYLERHYNDIPKGELDKLDDLLKN